jgi:hypothetical protein
MANWKKIFIGTGIGAGIIAGISYFRRLKNTSAQLETVSKASIHSVTIEGVTLRVDSVLKNPSKTKLKLKYPFVKILYNNSTIGTSQSINKDISLPAFGEANISGIMIKVPITGIFSAGTGIYKQYLHGEPINLTIKTISTVDLGWKKFPYESTEQKTINQHSAQSSTQQKQKNNSQKPSTTKKTTTKKTNTKNKTAKPKTSN